MKNLKQTSFVILGLVFGNFAQANIVDPSTLMLTAFELWASTATNCSNPVKVIDNGTSGKTVDIASESDFGEATLPPDGVYQCLIAVVNDTYTIVPAFSGTSAGVNNLCVGGTTYHQDTCATGTSVNLPDGSTTTCGTAQVDKVAAYISTAGADGNDGGTPGTAKKLNQSITVAGGAVDITLYVTNPDGLVNQGGVCGQNANAVLGVR